MLILGHQPLGLALGRNVVPHALREVPRDGPREGVRLPALLSWGILEAHGRLLVYEVSALGSPLSPGPLDLEVFV